MNSSTQVLTIAVTEVYKFLTIAAVPDRARQPISLGDTVWFGVLKHCKTYSGYRSYRLRKLAAIWMPTVAKTSGGSMSMVFATSMTGLDMASIAGVDGSVFGPVGEKYVCHANLTSNGDDWYSTLDAAHLGSRVLNLYAEAPEGSLGVLSLSYVVELTDAVAVHA
jgi:hypothetical protein